MELLAVIVILAVVALIATTSIIQIIDRAEKGALEDSAYGIIEAGSVFYIDHILPETGKENSERYNFEVIENKFVNVKNKEEKLAFKGSMPKSGKLQINANGDTAIAICNRKYCACKSITETKVVVQKTGCEIDEETGEIGTKKDTTPVGVVISYLSGSLAPEGYLSCDGSVYKIADYPKLAESFKEGFGSYNYYGGDGTTTFAVPDLRGEFLRGTGGNSHTSSTGILEGSGAAVGKHQDATVLTIIGNTVEYLGFSPTKSGVTSSGWGSSYINSDSNGRYEAGNGWIRLSGKREGTAYTYPNVATARPTNTSVLYCIKY